MARRASKEMKKVRAAHAGNVFGKRWHFRAVQRSVLCRSRRELSNAYFLAKFGFDTAENEPCQVCPIRGVTGSATATETAEGAVLAALAATEAAKADLEARVVGR